MNMIEWIARTRGVRFVCKIFIWSITYRCPECGKMMEQLQLESLDEDVQEGHKAQGTDFMFGWVYHCVNVECPDSSNEHKAWMIA